MVVTKVSLFSIVICFVIFDIMHCQDFPSGTDSLELSGGWKGELTDLNWFYSEKDPTYWRVMDEKCENNGYPNRMKEAAKEHFTCMMNFINKDEPLDNLPYGPERFCDIRKKIEICNKRKIEKLQICLNAKERRQLYRALDAVHQAIGYLCDNQGERISLFLDKNSSVCFEKLNGPLSECTNATEHLSPRIEFYELDSENIFDQMYGREQCEAIAAMRDCVVGTFQRISCDNPTFGDVVNTLYDIRIRSTPCKDLIEPSAATGVSRANALLAVATGAALLLRPAV